MNFKQFLLEEDNLTGIHTNDLKKIIQRDCAKYLKEIKDKVLYRGMYLINDKNGNTPSVAKIITRINRRPKNSSSSFHEGFNGAFDELHYVENIRSRATFCTGNQSDAGWYGPTYAIFPIGDYTYWWSPKVIDSFIDFSDNYHSHSLAAIEDFINVSEYTDKNLAKAISSRMEVMLLCDSYYAVSTKGRIDYYELIG